MRLPTPPLGSQAYIIYICIMYYYIHNPPPGSQAYAFIPGYSDMYTIGVLYLCNPYNEICYGPM